VKILAILAMMLGSAVADPRVDHVARALAAVEQLGAAGRDKLDRDLHAVARAKCHADAATPTPACLVEAATALCGGDATCRAAADVVAANLRAETDWVDEPTRIRLVRTSTDYRAALSAELRRHHAALAAELALESTSSDATAIDRLCRERDRIVHACPTEDASCVPSLPWSRCVAALVWFMAGAR
jgi:hypothetical protein